MLVSAGRCSYWTALTRVFIFVAIVVQFGSTQAAEPPAGWSTEFGPTGLNQYGYLTAAIEFEGDLVVAGWFSTAGRDTVEHIARWDGEHWLPLGAGLSSVECLAVHEGRLVAGGKFKAGGEVPANSLAYWNGTAWQGYSDRLQGDVYALATYRSELVVGGRFVIDGEAQIRHVARWDGTTWKPLGRGVAKGGRTRVQALEVHGNELVVAGVFGHAGMVETFHIARWDGQQWHSFGTGADDVVNAVQSSGDLLYAGGRFREVDGDSASCVAVWDGVSWSALGAGIRQKSFGDPVVNGLEVWRDELVVAGRFDTAGRHAVGSIAIWDGQGWNLQPPGFFDDPRRMHPDEVFDLTVFGGRLAAVGKMKGGPGFLVNHLGLWDGWHWDPLVAGQGIEGGVTEMKYFDGRLFVESSGAAGPGNLHGIVVWEDGHWQAFEPAVNDTVVFKSELKLMTEHNGRIMAFGKMHNTLPRTDCRPVECRWQLAEWDEGWRVVSPLLEFKVDRLWQLVSVGDDIVVLGSFKGPGEEHDRGVVWDGSQWRALNLAEEISNLTCSAVIDDRLFLAWQTRTKDDPPRFSVAEWVGGNWRIIKSGIHSQIHAMTGRDGRLVASFTIPHDECSESSALQEWDGREWRPLPGSFSYRYRGDARVQQLVMYQGDLVASGHFNGVDSLACRSVAFWDGEVWRPFAGGVTGEAHRLVPTESSLWLGGNFGTAGGEPSLRVARWDGALPVDTPVDSLPAYTPAEKPVTRRGDGWHSHALDMTDSALPFTNGDFLAWTSGLPYRWEWRTSSRHNCPGDRIVPRFLPAGGVRIKAGDNKGCSGWFAQRFAVEGNRFYRVRARYEASVTPAEGRRPACTMSIADYQRQPTGYEFGPLHKGMWVGLEGGEDGWAEIILRTDSKANVGVVTIGARAPGAELLLREVTVDTISMSEDAIVRMLIAELRSKYVPQSDRLHDWEELEHRFTGRKAVAEDNYERLTTKLLKALEERRVTLESGEADVNSVMSLTQGVPVPDEDHLTRERLAAIRGQLMDWLPWGFGAAMAWTRDGIAYVNLNSPRIRDEQLAELATAEGILIDLRGAGYNALPMHREIDPALELAGRFTTEPRLYGYSKPGSGIASAEDTLHVQPVADQFLGMPVVCLTGRGCMGLGTEFALMMKAMPNVTLVGRPTRGGNGGMARFSLPTGSHVNYPSRSLWSLDGELINDSRGLQPDLGVEPDGSLDPVFDEGLRVLRAKISQRQR